MLSKMVRARGMSVRKTAAPPATATESEDRSDDSVWWFKEEEHVNGYGFIPGTDMGQDVCSRAKYEAFWRKKNYNKGSRYKKKVSPPMVRRVRHLYQRVF
ncbi:hypothetical protein M758_UG197400 [Ceratodon purpureus]|nr:hypothetical protein M758_UG197400 [Ceratodon purpureus]